jgi:hypothetical protein
MSPPSSRLNSKPSKVPAEAGSKTVKAIIITNIPVNRMARRLVRNRGKLYWGL